jgi:hypothetical protein
MGHRTRDREVEDDDDGLDDLDEPAVADAEMPVSSKLLDDELLGELDELVEPALGHTLDEFVIDPALLRDDDGTALEDESWAEDSPTAELPALPWSGRAHLSELGLDLPCVLDPTRATSEWVLADPPEARRKLTVVIRDVRGAVELTLRAGSPAGIVLGRDWLSGRAVVDPSPRD